MTFKTILLLDDDPLFHKLLVPVLESRGHRVLSAHTGQQARRQMKKLSGLDLVVVDGQLPDCNGIDWIRELRETDKQTKVIFVSAYWRDAQSYNTLTKELGVAFVLHKPVMPSVFAAEVDLLLGRSTPEEHHVDNLEDTLLALRAEYARDLPEKLRELNYALNHYRGQPDNYFLNKEACARAHKLKGTAASYGFPQIGEVMVRIEASLSQMQDNVGTAALWKKIDADMESVIVQADEAAREVGQTQTGKAIKPPTTAPAYIPPVARILVVDTDEAFLDLIEEFGRERQVDIARATNAMEALDKACLNHVDAALIDVELETQETAFKLAIDLRQLPGYESLPLAFISSTAQIQSLKTEEVGQCLYFSKRQDADPLKEAVQQLIAIRQVARQRVLVVDDDLDFCRRMAFVLSYEGMQVRTLDDTISIMSVLHEFPPDAVILDVSMPGVSGFDICRMLRTIPRWKDLPVLFVTAQNDVDSMIAAFQSGADDYLVKPVVNEDLLTRMRVRMERARIMRDRVDRDTITGLLLRRPFMEQLAGMLSEGQRNGWSTTVCLIDIDNFSHLRDEHGYLTADEVLTQIGELLTRRLRAEDLKGRWNDEFFILAFRSETVTTISQMIRRLLEEIAELPFQDDQGRQFKVTCSAGLSRFPGDGNSIHELLQAADRRLKSAKTAGAKTLVSTG